MYANPYTADFNPHRQYAFLRKYENELLLIVANFDAQDTRVAVNIPVHAFDYFGLPTCYGIEATELFTEATTMLTLSPDAPARTIVPGHSGVILKIKLD